MARRLSIIIDITSKKGHFRRGYDNLRSARYHARREMMAPGAMLRVEGDARILDFADILGAPPAPEDHARRAELRERQEDVLSLDPMDDLAWADGFQVPWWAHGPEGQPR